MSRPRAAALLGLVLLLAAALSVLLVTREAPDATPGRTTAPEAVRPGAPDAPPAARAPASAPTRVAGAPPAAPATVRLSGRLVVLGAAEEAWVLALGPEGLDAPETLVLGREPQDPGAPPLPGATAGRPLGGFCVPDGAARADAAGEFALELAPGPWIVLAGAKGCRTRAQLLELRQDLVVRWPLEEEGAATLVLRCEAGDGTPLAGGVLRASLGRHVAIPDVVAVGGGLGQTLHGLASSRGEREDELELVLDGDGGAALSLHPGALTLGDLTVTPRRGAPLTWDEVELAPLEASLRRGERRAVVLREEAARGASVVVRVLDAAGAPRPGARVALVEADDAPAAHLVGRDASVADEGGRVTFLQVGAGVWFAVGRAAGRAGRVAVDAVSGPDDPREVDLRLDEADPFMDVVLRVVADETGQPVEHPAAWSLHDDGDLDASRIGPGLLRLDALPVDRATLVVTGEGRATRHVELDPRAAGTTVEVRLGPAAPVRGRLVGGEGRGQVELRRADGELLTAVNTTDDGAFELTRGPRPGEPLVLRARRGERLLDAWPVTAPADGLVVQLPSEPVVEVLVLRRDGTPMEGTTVVANDEVRVRADEAGRARFVGRFPPGARVRADGCDEDAPLVPGAVLQEPPPPDAPEPVVAAPEAELTGVVVDDARRPVAGALVWLRASRGASQALGSAKADASGRFALRAPCGTSELCVHRVDLGGVVLRVDVPAAGRGDLVVRLPRGVAVRVHAGPAADRVVAAPVDGAPPDLMEGWSDYLREDGAFDLGRLQPGRYRVQAFAGRTPLAETEVEVAAPGPVVVTLE